ncbi:tetratricopeptide repeat protein [Cellvibrio sp. OA-2007]|uniref:tetratricopeptide repeat protein n=1 Tax=Cellvibrio sp. OA-2007 TaxID=529823 RepID=UPI00078387BE|nr:SEL1-like repeat protein [Cellvibrio sp. OA-2007]
MENEVKQQAEELLENGEVEALYELLAPYLEQNDAYAQFLYSSFSLESSGETDEQFEARSMTLLERASEGGVAEASYRLAVIYLYGDVADNNAKSSSEYFERAIAQGHAHSKFTYGFNLYYGSGDVKQEKARGLKLLEEAAQEGVQLARDELNMIRAG